MLQNDQRERHPETTHMVLHREMRIHEKGSLAEKRWRQWQKVNQSVSHSG